MAIEDGNELLDKAWKRLSLPQQTILRALYGQPLTTEEELVIWSGLQGKGIYDELGYLTGVTEMVPYKPKEYDILTGVIGRQSGKSTEVTAFAAAYEIALGGHAALANGVELKFAFVAHDKGLAQTNMQGITRVIRSSPLLNEELLGSDDKLIGFEQVRFKNGITLEAMTNTLKSARGYGIAGVVMDELGFWYKDATAANPDKEVETAISYAMQRFEHAKQFRITTPWTKEGLAYEAWLAGTDGRNYKNQPDIDRDLIDSMQDHLVVYAPTAAMGVPEPLVTRKKLARAKRRDPVKFARESLAQFIDAQSGYLSHAAINEAVERRKTMKRMTFATADYIAVMDPAFRTDAYTLTIGHKEKAMGVVQDLVMGWEPPPGGRLNPAEILDKVKKVIDGFGISVVYSDQAQLESIQELALDRDFMVHGFDLTRTSKPVVMRALNTALNRGQIALEPNAKQTQQLKDLVRIVTDSTYERIAAPPGKHDDYATVTALMVHLVDKLPAVDSEDVAQEMAPVNRWEKSEKRSDVAARVRQRLGSSDDPEDHAILGRSDWLSETLED